MKVALIGYGKMGQGIESLLISRGHEVVLIIDENNNRALNSENLRQADVAIEFTTPSTAFDNVVKCLECGIPVVSGTTGWQDRIEEARHICEIKNGTFFYAPNYSIGVNIFAAVNEYLAKIMNQFEGYDVSIEEAHHIHKKDAPSGTAVMLAEGVLVNLDRKLSWVNGESESVDELKITSIREGEVPGNHTVKYSSCSDSIEITHKANDRSGFIMGAVLAAEFAVKNKGVLSMKDLIKL